MAVRSRQGRPRYVAFRIVSGGPVDRSDLVAALRRRTADWPEADRPRLVAFDGREGLLGCRHTAKDATIDLLRGLASVAGEAVTVETLGTSGTVRRARRKYLSPPVAGGRRGRGHL